MDRKYFDRDPSHLKSTPFGIFTDQAGYEPAARKLAVMPFECETFSAVDADGNTVYTGKASHHGFDAASGDDVYTADLSALSREGKYRVCAGGRASAPFEIRHGVYEPVLDAVLKAFYFLRCGCGLDERYAGVYAHGRCHTENAVLWDDHSVSLDVTGGWHDAGDYGRYVTAGACAAAHLLYAYRMFPKVFGQQDISIPKEDMPDILTECKYELAWLMKMQREDGAVYHKATTAMHAPFVMPEDDREQLYVFPVSTIATADLAAVCALAAIVYREFDSELADKLSAAALRSADWLDGHPEFINFTNPEGCNTGSYGERDDISNRFWAYSELFALTGRQCYYDKALTLADKVVSLSALGYSELGGLASLALIMSGKCGDELESRIKSAFAQRAADLRALSDSSGYSVAMHDTEYCWGSNMNLMKNGMIFIIDEYLNGTDSFEYAAGQLHYLLGVNAPGISYVTGIGEFCCNYPHLRPAHADGIEKCIPGMVSGGANSRPADPYAMEVIPKGTPPICPEAEPQYQVLS